MEDIEKEKIEVIILDEIVLLNNSNYRCGKFVGYMPMQGEFKEKNSYTLCVRKEQK